MSQRPLTILIPTYNPGDLLEELLLSIGRASLHLEFPIHVELSDDCSPKPLANYSKPTSYSDRLSIRLHTNERNVGEAGNVNDAVARLRAQGHEWLLLLHQDDFVGGEWLRRCYSYIGNWHEGLPEMVFAENTGIYSLDELPADFCQDSGMLDEPNIVDIPPFQPGLDYISDNWAWIPSGTLFHACAYCEMTGFFLSLLYAGDNDFLVRWLLSGRSVRQVRRTLIYKRIHQQSHSSTCLLNGWDNEGWCYLMLRYAPYKTPKRSRQDHVAWLYRNARMMLTTIRRRDTRLFWSRLTGVSIALRSLLVLHLPFCKVLLPRKVRRLLHQAPPINVRSVVVS